MSIDMFEREDKHPQTHTNILRFSHHYNRYRSDYIAWALQILDQQRKTLATHMHPTHTTRSFVRSAPNHGVNSETERPSRMRFMAPKHPRSLGSVE